jgi:hypothetical protein
MNNNNFRRGFSSFGKSFFNNKFNFNFIKTNINQSKFKIGFFNKYYMTQIFFLSKSQGLCVSFNKSQILGGYGKADDSADLEESHIKNDISNALVTVGDISLFREDCKWTCGTRLTGPQLPIATEITRNEN